MSKTFPGEKLLIKVVNDLADFLPYLVLVGGWVPYIYAKYIWKNMPNLAVTTADIDFVDTQGPILAEQENGSDEYISDLRQDIFERFKKLLVND